MEARIIIARTLVSTLQFPTEESEVTEQDFTFDRSINETGLRSGLYFWWWMLRIPLLSALDK